MEEAFIPAGEVKLKSKPQGRHYSKYVFYPAGSGDETKGKKYVVTIQKGVQFWNGKVEVEGKSPWKPGSPEAAREVSVGETELERCHEGNTCFGKLREMGLGHSKLHPRVIKVTPLQSQEAETPSAGPVFYALNWNLEEKSSYAFSAQQNQNQALGGLLPPLRESRYGRHPTVSRPMYLDIPLKHEESSIIKRHPPRRIQRLEPIDLPHVITSERLLSQQEARTRHKAKQELEKKTQLPMYTAGKRQYLHKMQMLEMNHKRQEAQMELMKSLQSKTRLEMPKLKDHNGNKITQSMRGSNGCDIITILPDETMNRDRGNPQDEEFLDYHTENDYCVRKIGKMEAWLCEQEAQGQLFWDTSSSDSDDLEKHQKRPQALVRTRTERIPVYDEFYDRE